MTACSSRPSEALGGYYLIDGDLDHALSVAKTASSSVIEVRPIMDTSGPSTRDGLTSPFGRAQAREVLDVIESPCPPG